MQKLKQILTFDFFIPKPYRVHIIYWLIILNIIIFHQLYDQYKLIETDLSRGATVLAVGREELRPRKEAVASGDKDGGNKILSKQEWVKQEVEKSGLKWSDIDCLIRNESGWNEYAINKNKNGTFDLGLVQINDIHKVARKDAFDYKFSTKWLINKRLRDGNYNAWYGFDKCK